MTASNTEYTSAEELKMLLDISGFLNRSLNLDELLPYIVSRAKAIVGAETVSILLHDSATDELFFRQTDGNTQEGSKRLKEIRFPAGDGIAGSVLRTGRLELIEDVAKDPRHYKAVDDQTRFRTKSLIAVPLEARGHVIGVMEACNKLEGRFSEKDLSALLNIAGIIAMPLDNARMHEKLQNAYDTLLVSNKAKDDLIERARAENARLRREIERSRSFAEIKGNSPQMLNLFNLCEKAIGSDVTVLIEGETGTGKELIARCIHYNGPRRDKPFVVQNCGGIPESLLASELFGHKRGAFTGAVSDKRGLFEIAHGGTVFLDEVGETPPAMQVSLLRALQEGEIRPLGSEHVKKVDVRVISATNRSLENDVRAGLFREDLFYRLNVFGIRAPALRERQGDIPILVDHFLRKYAEKNKKTIGGLSRKAHERLCAYPFPGNVRELENEISRAIVLAEEGGVIEVSHLSERVLAQSGSMPTGRETGKLKGMVCDMEKDVLAEVLEKHGGNKARAARELGLSRFGLLKKIKRYGL